MAILCEGQLGVAIYTRQILVMAILCTGQLGVGRARLRHVCIKKRNPDKTWGGCVFTIGMIAFEFYTRVGGDIDLKRTKCSG